MPAEGAMTGSDALAQDARDDGKSDAPVGRARLRRDDGSRCAPGGAIIGSDVLVGRDARSDPPSGRAMRTSDPPASDATTESDAPAWGAVSERDAPAWGAITECDAPVGRGDVAPSPSAEAGRPMHLRSLVYATALAIMLGWLVWIGKPVLLPILAAVISLYILSAAADGLGRVPIVGLAPLWLRRLLALAAFTLGVLLLFTLIVDSLARVLAALPRYESNLDLLVARAATLLGIEDEPTWARLRALTLDRFEASRLIAPLVGSIGGFGGTLFLTVLYASFLLAERVRFARKLALAMGDAERGARALTLLVRINERIGRYLLVKTLVNGVLGAVSYLIMWGIGIEFAPFWAVLIAVLNYIPYVGSLVGVLFPVLLSLAQFGSLAVAGAVLLALSAAQVAVGAVLEPRMMGRAFNLSPLVVLIALAVWGALWGVPGAILAVPLTASLVIVLAEIDTTRPLAVMLSANGRV